MRSDGTRSPDRAFVELDGRRVYLGGWDTPEARSAYHRLLAERHAGFPSERPTASAAAHNQSLASRELTVVEMVDQFESAMAQEHAEGLITQPERFTRALEPLVNLYGTMPVNQFRPKHLRVVSQAFVDRGLTKKTIRSYLRMVRRAFDWGDEREYLYPGQVYELSRVRSVKARVPDPDPVPPARMEDVNAVRPRVSRQVRAMIDLQLVTGARPGEMCIMRAMDIDTAKDPWEYRPFRHKNQHRGKARIIYLGPKAREIIAPFLVGRRVDAFLFSAAEAEIERRSRVHAERRTPLSCGNRPGSNRQEHPQHEPGSRYHTTSYARAVRRACTEAGVLCWSPNQLRHTFATRVRAEIGLDVTSTLLGHSRLETSQIYAEQPYAKARDAAREVG